MCVCHVTDGSVVRIADETVSQKLVDNTCTTLQNFAVVGSMLFSGTYLAVIGRPVPWTPSDASAAFLQPEGADTIMWLTYTLATWITTLCLSIIVYSVGSRFMLTYILESVESKLCFLCEVRHSAPNKTCRSGWACLGVAIADVPCDSQSYAFDSRGMPAAQPRVGRLTVIHDRDHAPLAAARDGRHAVGGSRLGLCGMRRFPLRPGAVLSTLLATPQRIRAAASRDTQPLRHEQPEHKGATVGSRQHRGIRGAGLSFQAAAAIVASQVESPQPRRDAQAPSWGQRTGG